MAYPGMFRVPDSQLHGYLKGPFPERGMTLCSTIWWFYLAGIEVVKLCNRISLLLTFV